MFYPMRLKDSSSMFLSIYRGLHWGLTTPRLVPFMINSRNVWFWRQEKDSQHNCVSCLYWRYNVKIVGVN